MKTTDLIDLLSIDAIQAQPSVGQQLRTSLLAGSVFCIILLMAFFGLNPHLDQMVLRSAFIIKIVWLITLMGFSLPSLFCLARPGVSAGYKVPGMTLALLSMIGLGGFQWLHTDSSARSTEWMGVSWQVCSVSIVALSLPVLGFLLWTLSKLAPTRPATTGAVAGLLAGSLAASIYSLHCTETSLVFFAVWYAGGIALVSALGAAIGARCLRW